MSAEEAGDPKLAKVVAQAVETTAFKQAMLESADIPANKIAPSTKEAGNDDQITTTEAKGEKTGSLVYIR